MLVKTRELMNPGLNLGGPIEFSLRKRFFGKNGFKELLEQVMAKAGVSQGGGHECFK